MKQKLLKQASVLNQNNGNHSIWRKIKKQGLIGVVAPDGTFYAIAKTGTLSACHQEELRKLSILLSKNQPCNTLGSLFYKKREQIEHPKNFI